MCVFKQVIATFTDPSIVNSAAKQHNRVVYSSQAIHHIASQIASLYWAAISQEAQSQATFAKGVGQLTDLSKQW